MDMDIDMGDALVPGNELPIAEMPTGDDILQPDELEEPGEVADDEPPKQDEESTTLAPTKLHIRGVDNLHTDDIKAYVKSHYAPVDRVEWIDDNSANLVFSSESTARDALVALSTVEIADASALGIGESLAAKPLEGKPEASLQVRFAVLSDRKQKGAATRSRYYLMHPEHDPEERRRRNQEGHRSRYRERDGDYRGRRRRSDFSDGEAQPFDASMYDDAPAPARRRPRSESEDRPRSYARENRGKELLSYRAAGRDRSASPMRDSDGDAKMDAPQDPSRRNRDKARAIKDRLSVNNGEKELFPSKGSAPVGRGGTTAQLDKLESAIGSAHLREEDHVKVVTTPFGANGNALNIRGQARQRGEESAGGFSVKGAANARELFPNRFGGGANGGSGSNVGKELFDSNRSKPRQRAEDLFS